MFALPAAAQDVLTERLERACEVDIQRFCAGLERGGGAILNCIAENYLRLSDTCRQAFDAAEGDAAEGDAGDDDLGQ
ncbi:MAG: cysteine rich repeat-containing protein [Dichotomicrobium sp.]